MGYEDRDYFKSKPKFELTSGLHKGTKLLIIALIAAYIAALVISDQLEFARLDFWDAVRFGNEKALLGYSLFVLTPMNVIPVRGSFDPGHWKLLTHWLVAPGLIAVIIDVIAIYFVGKMIEQLFGTRRFVLLFLAGCVISGLLAALVDGWLVPGKTVVIMGPSGGLVAGLITPVWIAPRQKSFLGWELRWVLLSLIGIFVVFSLVMALVGKDVVQSPTQLAWGAAVGALYMLWLKKRGQVPSVAGGYQQEENLEPWEKQGYLNDYKEKPFDEGKFLEAAEKQRKTEAKALDDSQKDREKLDEILAKISRSGVGSLTRAEKKFLDAQSKKK
jgi:membrane associated rhomboid family serine protease